MEIQYRISFEIILRLYEDQIINTDEKKFLKDYVIHQIKELNLKSKYEIEGLLQFRLKILRQKFTFKQFSSESLHSINEETDNDEED